jgi:RHS repeat-associated protein
MSIRHHAFSHDANGNMLTGNRGSFAYTGANPVQTIGQTFTDTHSPEDQRVEQISASGTTTYLGFDPLLHAEKRSGAGQVVWADYLDVAGEEVGVIRKTVPTSGSTTTQVLAFVADQIGSISTVATGTVGATGSTLTQQGYDAWGKRRYPNGTDDTANVLTGVDTHGFTGQEEIDAVGLVNLNRRLYDPWLGRFLGPDPITQGFFANPQGLNRYAYAGNQPLNITDTTGKCPVCAYAIGYLGYEGVIALSALVVGGAIAAKTADDMSSSHTWYNDPVNTESPNTPTPGADQPSSKGQISPQPNDPPGTPVPGSDSQFGHKYGEHMDPDLPGYRTPEEYRQRANDLYNDPDATKTQVPDEDGQLHKGETVITDGKDVLRLDQDGKFRSMYPADDATRDRYYHDPAEDVGGEPGNDDGGV